MIDTYPPNGDTFDSDLRVAIQRLARRLRSQKAGDVTDTQFSVLCVLDRENPIGLADLAAHERVTPPSMNRTVNSLVEAGLASRTPDADDGRKVVLDITDAGHTLIIETRKRRDAWFSLRLAELTPEQRDALAAAAPVLTQLAQS
jgi:DNA-binding MarR family transcriptional regulator